MRLSPGGLLMPMRGFSRAKEPLPRATQATWRTHDGLFVISSREIAYLPGTDHETGPQWHLSVSRTTGGADTRCRVTDDDVARVADCFGMPAVEEDNHHPGIARHLWCPVDEQYRGNCECKLSELVIVEPSGYTWTTEAGECRGCWFERMFGHPCPRHTRIEV